MKTDVAVTFRPVPESAIKNAFDKALFACREQILTDCNYFVRVDQGILRDTAYVDDSGDGISVIYPQEYAKKVYYTGNPSKAQNPNASLMWCEKAHGQFGREWREIIEKGMNSAL